MTDASFHCSGSRSVRDPFWVQCYVSLLDIVAAHKVTVYIIQDLVTVNISVIVRCRNCFWMVIVQSRNKRTNNKCRSFECLVHRRRLMYPSCNGLKIVDAEPVRGIVTIPTDYIKRMCRC